MTAPAWLVEGADCVVAERERFGFGYVRAIRGTVGKVGKTHFVVDGVGATAADPLPLAKFRVAANGNSGHEQAGDGRAVVYPPDAPAAVRAVTGYVREAAEDAVLAACGEWDKARQRSRARSRSEPDEQAGEVGPALYVLADAVIALRGIYDEQGIVECCAGRHR